MQNSIVAKLFIHIPSVETFLRLDVSPVYMREHYSTVELAFCRPACIYADRKTQYSSSCHAGICVRVTRRRKTRFKCTRDEASRCGLYTLDDLSEAYMMCKSLLKSQSEPALCKQNFSIGS
jgi:hypothetical protein